MLRYEDSATRSNVSRLALSSLWTILNVWLTRRCVVAGGISSGRTLTALAARIAIAAGGFASPTVATAAMVSGVRTFFATVTAALRPIRPTFTSAEVTSCPVGGFARGSDASARRCEIVFFGWIEMFSSAFFGAWMSLLMTSTAVLNVVDASARPIVVTATNGSPPISACPATLTTARAIGAFGGASHARSPVWHHDETRPDRDP